MAKKPNQKSIATFLAVVFLFLALLPAANAAELVAPKTAKVGETVKVSVKNLGAETNLEITLSARSMPEARIVKMPATGEIEFKDLSEGLYTLGLRRTGERKYLDFGSFRVVEVLK